MKLLRTTSTARLIVVFSVLIVVLTGAAVAVAGSGGGGPVPGPKPLPQAIHDALAAPEPAGVTARISFTNNLFPSGALTGTTGSALMTGADGRLWLNQDGGRIELQSDAGDVQVFWTHSKLTVYDASSNTAYVADLPKETDTSTGTTAAPTLDQISAFLADLAKHWTVSGATPSDVAGQAAYTVSVSPSHDGGLLGSAELAWDAAQGVPLKIAIYAQGSSSAALALQVDQISYGAVPESDIAISVPAGAKTIDLSSAAGRIGAQTARRLRSPASPRSRPRRLHGCGSRHAGRPAASGHPAGRWRRREVEVGARRLRPGPRGNRRRRACQPTPQTAARTAARAR